MSRFTHQSQQAPQACIGKDDSVVQPVVRYRLVETQRWDVMVYNLWPGSRWINCNDPISDPNNPGNISLEDQWEWPQVDDIRLGKTQQQLYYIAGQCRDSGGAPLGPCVVRLYRTADDLEVDSCLTDSLGNYRVYTPYTGAHYCVAYKAGSPDVAGTTVNTLVGTAM